MSILTVLKEKQDFLYGKTTKEYVVIIAKIDKDIFDKLAQEYKGNNKPFPSVIAIGDPNDYNSNTLKDIFNEENDEYINPAYGFFDIRKGNIGRAKGLYSHSNTFFRSMDALDTPEYIIIFKYYGIKDYKPVKEITLDIEQLKTQTEYGKGF